MIDAHTAGKGCKYCFQVAISSVRNVIRKWQWTGTVRDGLGRTLMWNLQQTDRAALGLFHKSSYQKGRQIQKHRQNQVRDPSNSNSNQKYPTKWTTYEEDNETQVKQIRVGADKGRGPQWAKVCWEKRRGRILLEESDRTEYFSEENGGKSIKQDFCF